MAPNNLGLLIFISLFLISAPADSSLISDITYSIYATTNQLIGGGILNETIRSGLKVLNRACAAKDARFLFSRKSGDSTNRLNIDLFSRNGRQIYNSRAAPRALSDSGVFEPRLTTVIYIHGFMDDSLSDSSQAVVSSYLMRGDHNVLLVDASEYLGYNDINYLRAVRFVPQLAEALAVFVDRLTNNGVPVGNIHMIGFSIGAHIAGLTGRLLQRHANKVIPRITALDAANPCFSKPSAYRLQKGDALYVDVIHTTTGTLGLLEPLGHADFYVNGLSGIQPKCNNLPFSCSHSRSWLLYAETVVNPNRFTGWRCNDWKDLKRRSCSRYERTLMGYGSSPDSRGVFIVYTNDFPP